MKSEGFGKCFHLIFLYIIGYNNISGRSDDPPRPASKNMEGRVPQLPVLTPMNACNYQMAACIVSYLRIYRAPRSSGHQKPSQRGSSEEIGKRNGRGWQPS